MRLLLSPGSIRNRIQRAPSYAVLLGKLRPCRLYRMEPDSPSSFIEDFETTGQRGHLAEEMGVYPKKDDVAMLAVISLGYDSPKRSRPAKPEPNGPQFRERG